MKNLMNLKELHIHFIGIGGISMSGLALLVDSFGARVSGSDATNSSQIEHLKSRNIEIFIGHSPSNISIDTNLVVYTGAIANNNEELIYARSLGIKVLERSEFLGLLSREYNCVVAVSGTHGKTTTTAMISEIFSLAGLNPTIHIGGNSLSLRGNTIVGDTKYLIVEACEYRESFLRLKVDIGVITNIESDHLDYYKDFDTLKNAFGKFASNAPNIITDIGVNINHLHKTIVNKDYEARNIEYIGNGYNFNVFKHGKYYMTCRLNLLGAYNINNALFAIAVADMCGIDKSIIERGLSGFLGVERRCETIYKYNDGCKVIIDYAHHPTEIENICQTIGQVYNSVLYVFQPHTYTRTLSLYDDFIEVLSKLDDLIIFKTYEAREQEIVGGRAEDLYNTLKSSKGVEYFESNEELLLYIEKHSFDYDCVLILGAGDLAEKLKNSYNCKIIAKSIDKSQKFI